MAITWTCERCNQPIDDSGSLGVDTARVASVEKETAKWNEAHRDESGLISGDLGEYLDLPDPAHWTALHASCRDHDRNWYEVPVQDLQEAWGLVEWTARLMEKNWLDATDWDQVLRDAHARR